MLHCCASAGGGADAGAEFSCASVLTSFILAAWSACLIDSI